MAGYVRAFFGGFFILFAIFFRFYFFSTDVLYSLGFSPTEAYNIMEKIKVFDPFYYIFTLALGIFLIIWGVTSD